MTQLGPRSAPQGPLDLVATLACLVCTRSLTMMVWSSCLYQATGSAMGMMSPSIPTLLTPGRLIRPLCRRTTLQGVTAQPSLFQRAGTITGGPKAVHQAVHAWSMPMHDACDRLGSAHLNLKMACASINPKACMQCVLDQPCSMHCDASLIAEFECILQCHRNR